MDRSQLRNMIGSGRSIALDCFAIGEKIPEDDPIGRLFKTDIMNKSVILKRYDSALPTARQPVNVTTVIYFPYDFENVYDGGESVSFRDIGFFQTLSFKIAKGEPSEELRERIEADVKTLSFFDSLHSLDPFLLKSKAEQSEIEGAIHPSYFAISAEEWERIRGPIREKISKLVTKALGDTGETGGKEGAAREQYVQRFLMKIWEAKDVNGIEPFVDAMQMDPKNAPEIFFAWKAICYYQVRFRDILAALKTLFQWTGNNQLCFPVDFVSLSDEEQKRIKKKRVILREKMRESYIGVNNVLSAYEQSYNEFVDKDHPETFMDFLVNAENSYLLLANHVSIATHSVNLWKWYVEQYGAEMRYTQFMEVFDGLVTLYGADGGSDLIEGL
jgi:hypothetical protein